MNKILMIDDDQTLCRSLTYYLAQYDLQLITANTPTEGLLVLTQEQPNLLLLDVMMPEMDGFALCKKVRETHTLPIIMLTARGHLNDRVQGLELGADDYMAKPFEPRELVARIQVLLRRLASGLDKTPKDNLHNTLAFDGLVLHLDQHIAEVDGIDVKLTGMEFELLAVLATRVGKVLNRDQVISEIKGVEVELFSRSVDILLSRLRQKLNDDPKKPRFIKTLRNVGYTFVAKSI